MKKMTELKTKLFKGTTNNEAEDRADRWSAKHLKEIKRTSWVGKDLMFNVEITVVVKKWEVD